MSGVGFSFSLDAGLGAAANDLVLHVGAQTYPLADATYNSGTHAYAFFSNIPTWADGDAVCLALTADSPAVSSVALTSTPGTDNTYAIGDSVAATVTFDAAVDISGTPQLELDFDGTAKGASCTTATNTTTMACSYTVGVGDEAVGGVGIAANKLTGGTIYGTGHTTLTADLDHVAVLIDTGHKVDGIRPTLVTTGSDAPTTSTDGTQVILTFSEDLGISFVLNVVDLSVGGVSGQAAGATPSISGGRTVTLTLVSAATIAAGETVTLTVGTGAVQDAAGNTILGVTGIAVTNAVGSTTAPTVSGVALTSAPGVDNTYAIGDAVEATVTFDAAVDITAAAQLALDFDGTAKAAACATGTNTTTMACSYTVAVDDAAPNGVAIAANTLTGGTIYATGSTTTSADLDHVAVAIDAGHTVDGIRPTLVTTGSDAPTTSADGETVLLVFSEDIGAVSHSDITIQANSVTLSTTMASVAGTKVELTLTTALTASVTTLTVALAADAVDDAAGNGNLVVAATTVTNAVSSTGSNTAPAFSSTTTTRSVAENSGGGTNVGAPVTATDADNDPLTYTLEGMDASSFTIVSTSGQIRTRSGVTYDYETKPSYTVIVKAEDSNGGSAIITVTIDLTDVFEPLGPPTNLRSTRGNEQVTLRWTAPVNTGGGPITDYEYEQDGDGNWISTGGTATRYTVTGLTNGQSYTFRVRAVNGIDAPAQSSSLSATPRRPRPPPPPPPPRRVVVRPTALTVAEGGSGEYTVVLTRRPTGPVEIEATVSGSPDVTALPVSLTFTASNWNAAQTVTVSVVHDGDALDDTATVSHTVSGGGYGSVTAASVEVTVTEDETESTEVALTLSPAVVSEGAGSAGQTVTVTGMLNGGTLAEATAVTMTVAGGTATEGDDFIAVSGFALTIPADATGGTTTFTLVPVDDDLDEDDETLTVSGTTTSGLTVTPTSFTVTITDDDERGMVVSPTALTMAEGGSGEYTVVLTSEPTGPVTVEATVSGSPDVTALPVTRTFTPSDWDVPQTVTASAAHDGDAVDDTATVSHAASGGDYGGVTAEPVEVTVTDDETESTEVALTLSPAVVSEGAGSAGQTVTVTGTLNSGTRAEATVVTVTVGGGTATEGDDYTPVSDFTLTIPADATSGTTTFTLVPVDDALDEDDETLTVSGTTTSGLTVMPASLTVTITDDEDTPTLSVADAQGAEDAGSIAFTVTLSGASSKAVTVDWETSDGTATAGRDYEAVSGTLTFAAHQTERLVTVPVLDDAVDEAEERFSLRLSNPVNAQLGDAEAVGTIVGRDALPQAWLARFGRTAAGHVLDAVDERLTSTRSAGRAETAANGLEVTVGGRRLSPTLDGAVQDGFAALSRWMPEETGLNTSPLGSADGTRQPSGRDLLAGSAFRYQGSAGANGTWSLWGGGAFTQFDGREENVELDGEVLTGTVGIDFGRNRWLAGLVLSQSRGDGVFSSSSSSGDLESSLTGLYPYLRYQASRRVSVWGLGGYGKGTLGLAEQQQTDMAMTMAAAGIRGELLSPTDGRGLSLALATDALWLRTSSDALEGVLAAEAEVSRLRLRIEGSYGGSLGGSLAPTFELGVRQDAGDAETGFGLEVGGGLRYAARGLTANLGVRGLLAHEDQYFQERGVVGSIIYDSNPSSDLGLSFSLSPSWGAASSGGGTDALWARETMNGIAGTEAHMPGGRLDAELGYGVPVLGGRGVVTPYTGLVVSEGGRRDLHLGWRLNCGSYCNLMLGLKRPESAVRNMLNEYSVMLQARLDGNRLSELYDLGRSVLDRR